MTEAGINRTLGTIELAPGEIMKKSSGVKSLLLPNALQVGVTVILS